MQKKVRDVSLLQAFKIIWTGRGVTPFMMANLQLEEAELRLLEMQLQQEIYQAEVEMLKKRVTRLRAIANEKTKAEKA